MLSPKIYLNDTNVDDYKGLDRKVKKELFTPNKKPKSKRKKSVGF